MVEFVIAFPVLLLLTLGILQLAFLYSAQQVVHYASYSAARRVLVAENIDSKESATYAASFVCSGITGMSGYGGTADYDLPGWGALQNSGASREKTRVTVLKDYDDDDDYVEVEVEHDYELAFPVVNELFAAWFAPTDEEPFHEDARIGDAPHITLKQRCKLPKNFSKVE